MMVQCFPILCQVRQLSKIPSLHSPPQKKKFQASIYDTCQSFCCYTSNLKIILFVGSRSKPPDYILWTHFLWWFTCSIFGPGSTVCNTRQQWCFETSNKKWSRIGGHKKPAACQRFWNKTQRFFFLSGAESPKNIFGNTRRGVRNKNITKMQRSCPIARSLLLSFFYKASRKKTSQTTHRSNRVLCVCKNCTVSKIVHILICFFDHRIIHMYYRCIFSTTVYITILYW